MKGALHLVAPDEKRVTDQNDLQEKHFFFQKRGRISYFLLCIIFDIIFCFQTIGYKKALNDGINCFSYSVFTAVLQPDSLIEPIDYLNLVLI